MAQRIGSCPTSRPCSGTSSGSRFSSRATGTARLRLRVGIHRRTCLGARAQHARTACGHQLDRIRKRRDMMNALGGCLIAIIAGISTLICLIVIGVSIANLGPFMGAGIGLVIGTFVAVGKSLNRATAPPQVTSEPHTFFLPDHLLVVQGQSGWFWCQRCRQQMYGMAQVHAMPCEPSSLDQC